MVRSKQAEAAAKRAATLKKMEETVIVEEQAPEEATEDKVEIEMEEDETVVIEDEEPQDEGNPEEDAAPESGERKEWPSLTEEDHAFIADLLKTKVKLSDDTESDLFSYGPPKFNSSNPATRLVTCHLCRVTNLQRPDFAKSHVNGKRHLDKIKKPIDAEKFLEPFLLSYKVDGDDVKQLKIFPGENIPDVTDEYESRIVDKVHWEKPIESKKLLKMLSIDPIYEYNKSRPILGLDYLLKMKHRDTIKVYCVLCDMYVEPRTYQHVTSAKHQATYIIKHFPTLYEEVVDNLKITNYNAKETALRNIFRKFYRKIEIKFGFKEMHLIDGDDFHKNSLRKRYLNKARKAPHYDENSLEFTEAEVNVLIRKSNNNIPFNQPDPPALPTDRSSFVGRGSSRKRGPTDSSIGDAPAVKNQRDNETELEKWAKYRDIMSKRLSRVSTQYKKYEQDPQYHPSYQDEWSQFWHARCAQLKKDNIDPDTYNFDKEWRPFWEKRLRKLYNKDVAERKAALRQSFGLPVGRRTPSPSNQLGNARQSNQSWPVSISGNFSANNSNNFGRGDGPGSFSQRQRLRMEQQQQEQQQQLWNRSGLTTNRRSGASRIARDHVSIISVLRLLTALEDQLGSLGPKAVELLSKAVLWEKNNQNMNDLLTDNDYYVLFATSKEKLKGLIMTNVIDNSKIRAVNTAIEDLSTILDIVEKANRSSGLNQQSGRGNDNNLFGGGNNNYGNNTGFGGNTFSDDNFGNDGNGNFRNNDGSNFGNSSGGNYHANVAVANRSTNDGGSYRNVNNDAGNYRGGGGFNAGGNYRNNSNDGGNYRDSNDGGNYQSANNNGSNYRGTNTASDVGNYRGGNNNEGGNYRAGNNEIGVNRGSTNDGSNYRSSDIGSYNNNDGGNNYNSTNNTASNYRNNNSGNNFSSSSFGTGNTNDNQNHGNNPGNFNSKSNSFGGGSTSNQRGNWMVGGGGIYSSLTNKSNTSTPVFSSDIGIGSNRLQSLMSFDKNTSSNYGLGGVGSRRFN